MNLKKTTILITGVLAMTMSAGVAYALPATNATPPTTGIVSTDKVGDKAKVHHRRNCGVSFAKILEMDPKLLEQELKSGKTLAQIAVAKGITADILTQKIKAEFDKNINDAVTNGKLSNEKATELKAKTSEKAANLVNKSLTGPRGDVGKRNEFKAVRQQISAFLGVEETQLKDKLKSGMSLVEIAKEKGIEKNALISKVQSIMKADLDQALKSKKITADEATQIESKLPQMIERMVNHVNAPK
ncbi:hypothetical protein [Desulfosporosinus sp. Sb-LF]|uniref:hypothetical protein n=1 Tax=Desulfosporosinus sp. Sb-LF TaxID=2560027 RepID=UPI00107FCF4E|nr:hypothetical protein [Desulfosporosinus sp. Sb-LF]TGE33451.1 hypothetical protein E4K68_08175 [Desulfosporosinus sp. Sb-LF]